MTGMQMTDVQNLLQCLVAILMLPIPVIFTVAIIGKLLMPKSDHK